MNTKITNVHFTDKYLLAPTNQLTVTLIGAGGTGSQMLTSLARINISLQALGHPGLWVKLIDDDLVTKANCGRQLFAETEIGLHKSVALIHRINRFFGTDWIGVTKHITARSSSEEIRSNIVITCVDSVKARFDVSKLLKSNKQSFHNRDAHRYWMDFGNDKDTGQVLLATTGTIKQPESKKYNPCSHLPSITEEYKESLLATNENTQPSCSMVEALSKQDLFINTAICALGSSLLWSLLSEGMIFNRGFFLNLRSLKSESIKI